jgi:hypothetical protein
MTCGIGFADIRLDLDDHAARADAAADVDQDLAKKIARDVERGPRVKRARELFGTP